MKGEVGLTTEGTESTKGGRSRRLQPSSSYPHAYGLGFGKATNTWEEEVLSPRHKGEKRKMGLNHQAHEEHEGEDEGEEPRKALKYTKEERLIEDNSPYPVRGFQAWENPLTIPGSEQKDASRDAPATLGGRRFSRKAAKTPREEEELNLERVS